MSVSLVKKKEKKRFLDVIFVIIRRYVWLSPWQGRTAGNWPVWTCRWTLPGSPCLTWSRVKNTASECAPSTSTASATLRTPASQSPWENRKVRDARCRPVATSHSEGSSGRWRSSASFICCRSAQMASSSEKWWVLFTVILSDYFHSVGHKHILCIAAPLRGVSKVFNNVLHSIKFINLLTQTHCFNVVAFQVVLTVTI